MQTENTLYDIQFTLAFAVLMDAIRSFLSSMQSFSRGSPISSEIYAEAMSSLSQYSVSAVSFNAICSLDMKSALFRTVLCGVYRTKEQIIRTKILPYFKDKKMSEIMPSDVLALN